MSLGSADVGRGKEVFGLGRPEEGLGRPDRRRGTGGIRLSA